MINLEFKKKILQAMTEFDTFELVLLSRDKHTEFQDLNVFTFLGNYFKYEVNTFTGEISAVPLGPTSYQASDTEQIIQELQDMESRAFSLLTLWEYECKLLESISIDINLNLKGD